MAPVTPSTRVNRVGHERSSAMVPNLCAVLAWRTTGSANMTETVRVAGKFMVNHPLVAGQPSLTARHF